MRSGMKLLVAAMVAAAASLPAHADPGIYHYESAGATATIDRGTVHAWIDGWSFPVSGDTSLCVGLWHEGSHRTDVGCGRGIIDIEPTLRTAHLAGTIVSEVYDTETWTSLGDSSISVDVTFEGTGVPVAGTGAGSWLGTPQPGSMPVASVDGGAYMSRSAVATGSVSSKAMCTLPGKAPSRTRPHKGRARPRTAAEPCSSSTGVGAMGHDAWMQQSLSAGGSTSEDGECGKTC